MHLRTTHFGKMAHALLSGTGIEIGPLHMPFDLDATVLYTDRYTTKELHEQYKEHDYCDKIVPIHFVSKDDKYPFICNDAFDFVISSHVLEHLCNQGMTIQEWLRIIKTGGCIYMVVPHKDYCFDKTRNVSDPDQLIDKFQNKVDFIGIDRYIDYFTNIKASQEFSFDFILEQYKKQTSIHVHTFTLESLLAFFDKLSRYLPFSLEYFEQIGALHLHVAIRKK